MRHDLTGQRALVTGATGFIGGRLLVRLLERGAEVAATSRTPPGGPEGVAWHALDLSDADAVRRAVRTARPDVIYDLASQVLGAPDVGLVVPMLRDNLLGAVNLLVAAQEAGGVRVVQAGSMMEPKPGDPVDIANSPYAMAKWAASRYGRMFGALYASPVVHLRIHMSYGPGQRDPRKLFAHVALSALAGRRPRVSSGRHETDWVFVEDVVDALIAAGTAPGAPGSTVDVGSGRLTSLREVCLRLAAALNPAVEPVFGARDDRPLEFPRRADPSTWAAIDWRPATDLDDGIARTAAWYRAEVAAGRL